jgi:hypothetical protein
LTAALGDQDQAWADALRQRYFPPERNQVPAHITLFHHLPPSVEAELLDQLKSLCARQRPQAKLSKVMNFGRGVAFRVESDDLMMIRDQLAQHFHGLLIPQDQAVPRLHITVQNKVDVHIARQLASELDSMFKPRPLVIAGLSVWRYLGGPWQPIKTVRFRGSD